MPKTLIIGEAARFLLNVGPLLVVATAFLVSGCTGAGTAGPQATTEDEATSEPGRLRVLVINDEYMPVARADVYILELAVNATTNRLGDAFFVGVPPGVYTVQAEQGRFFPNRTMVEVGAEPTATARVWLAERPPDIYLIDFRREVGYCVVGTSTAGSQCRDAPYLPSAKVSFPMERGFVWGGFQMSWEATTPAASEMAFDVAFDEVLPFADGRTVISVEGTSPLEIYIEEDLVAPAMAAAGQFVTVTARPSSDAVKVQIAQQFEVFAQLVYFHEADHADAHSTHG